MSSHPKISVITTVYNCEAYIEKSIRSILAQTEKDFEFIVINDGSTDSTWTLVRRILEEYPGAKLISSPENKRIPTRRNEAIALARGEYIAIHDGDDISLPDRLYRQRKFLEHHSDVFCVGSHAIGINESGRPTKLLNYPPQKHEQIVSGFRLGRINPIIDPSTMFRRSGFEALGGYSLDSEVFTVPDLDLWTRAALAGFRMRNIPDALIQYRFNKKGMTSVYNSEMREAHKQVCQRFDLEMKKREPNYE